MVEVAGERLAGIEAVLRQGERAGAAGGPGVDQRRLNDVVAAGAALDKATRVGHNRLNVGPAVEVAGELGERPAHGLDDRRIDLDGRHVWRACRQGGQHVAPATGADDQGGRVVDEVIGHGGQVVAQEFDRAQVAVEALDGRAGDGVDEQQGVVPLAAGGDGLFPLDRRDAPEEREDVRLIDCHARMDVPALIDDGRLFAAGLVDDDAQPGPGEIRDQQAAGEQQRQPGGDGPTAAAVDEGRRRQRQHHAQQQQRVHPAQPRQRGHAEQAA